MYRLSLFIGNELPLVCLALAFACIIKRLSSTERIVDEIEILFSETEIDFSNLN